MIRAVRIAATSVMRNLMGEETYGRVLRRVKGPEIPPVGSVRFGDFRRLEPMSREYGFDRGVPIDRYYIEKFLSSQSHLITGRVLEIGERLYTEKFGQNVAQSDMLHVDNVDGATYVDDLTEGASVPSGIYDCLIITQTLHLIFDMRAAVQTMYRVLKPGGVLLCTVPGITQVADSDWNETWYWALTRNAAVKLFGLSFAPGNVDVTAYGNVLSAVSFLQGLSATELREYELDEKDSEYPVTVAIAARKGDETQHEAMADRWTYAPGEQFAYDEDTSYKLGMAFLDGAGDVVEDWGCGPGYAKRFVTKSRYVGIDGSAAEPDMVKSDLQDYRSEADCVFIRHVLEHNWGWRAILANAVASFRKRLVLIVFTPLGGGEQRLDNNGEGAIPDLQLDRDEILGFFAGCTVREETIKSATEYGTETIFYVER
ncbi:methyltransferase domain-containing protein [Novosphingobium sp. MD-1]|uniref:methyltransferase domain-containing protein n=1 Tax=Novosphingobium sp. MD-1 TaxID=1630648 RepID=UPI0018F77C97|nr:methyltransferase domain-containing protein [Novosphingobium sp. MD-1]